MHYNILVKELTNITHTHIECAKLVNLVDALDMSTRRCKSFTDVGQIVRFNIDQRTILRGKMQEGVCTFQTGIWYLSFKTISDDNDVFEEYIILQSIRIVTIL